MPRTARCDSTPISRPPHSNSCTLTSRDLPHSDTCWCIGAAAHIKPFFGPKWTFALADEAVSREFVDAIRLGISACLSSNHTDDIALFQPDQQTLPLRRTDSADAEDDFAISLGQVDMVVAGGAATPPSPASMLPSLPVGPASCSFCDVSCRVPVLLLLLLLLLLLAPCYLSRVFSGPVHRFTRMKSSKFIAGMGARSQSMM